MTRCMRLFVLSHGRPHASTAPGRCRTQGKYAEAELLYKRSLAIYEQASYANLSVCSPAMRRAKTLGTRRKSTMTATTDNPLEPLLTVKETARILNTCEKTVRRRIKESDLSIIRDGRNIRIHPADLKRYIAINRLG